MDSHAVLRMLIFWILFVVYSFSSNVDATGENNLNADFPDIHSLKDQFFDPRNWLNDAENTDGFYMKKLVDVESRFFEIEERLNSAEKFYEKKLAQAERLVLGTEKRLKAAEKSFEMKLAETENKIHKTVSRLRSAEKFYGKKLREIRNRCLETEEKLKSAEKMYDNLRKANDRHYDIEQRLTSTEEFYERKLLSEKETRPYLIKKRSNITEEDIAKQNSSTIYGTTNPNFEKIIEPKREIVESGRNEREPLKSFLAPRKSKSEVTGSTLVRRLLGHPVGGSQRVAFSAYVSQNPTELGKEHTIPFDQVLLNDGQAYDPVIHVFICPVSGVYMFQSAVMSNRQQVIQTEIVKDGIALVIMYAAGSTPGHGWDQGFNSVIVDCNQGQRVWVRVHLHEGTTLEGYRYTTFSGFLLYES